MCDQCRKANGQKIPDRVLSIADLSTQLLDAFQESNGEHRAVVFVDDEGDLFDIMGITHDAEHEVIKIHVTSPYTSIRSKEARDEIAEINA